MIKTANPGYLVYEDAYQVVAENLSATCGASRRLFPAG